MKELTERVKHCNDTTSTPTKGQACQRNIKVMLYKKRKDKEERIQLVVSNAVYKMLSEFKI